MTKKTGSGTRDLSVRVKTAKGRKIGSTRWLQRQLNDPYVAQAKKDGYRSRAAYKLIELDEKFRFLKPGMRAIDLGAAPGGWTQVVIERCPRAQVIALDILEMQPLAGAMILQGDFMDDATPGLLKKTMGGRVDLVLSDIAPNTTGHAATDHIRIVMMVEAAAHFAFEVLKPGGCFVAKVRQGGTENELLAELKKHFTTVKHAKPKASRQDSAETYLVATRFRD